MTAALKALDVMLAPVLNHPDIGRVGQALRATPGARLEVEEPARRAAVALILRLDQDCAEPQMLLIKRATFEGDPWSGHVALPGGRQEPGDVTLEQTATRETWEETGIDLRTDGRVLGCLDELQPRTPVLPPIVITPFVAVVRPDVRVVPSPEVAAAFWLDLATLRDPEITQEVELRLQTGPRRVMSFQHGEHTIWGLTERILRQFLRLTAGQQD